MADYHLHLHPHGYGDDVPGPPPGLYPEGHIERYVEVAAARGVHELGFTEHLYRCVEAAPVLGRFWESEPRHDLRDLTAEFVTGEQNLSLGGYVDAVLAAKDRGLPVKLGLEVDFFPHTIESVLDLLAPYPFDFLIGSVHWVGGWSIDHHGSAAEFDRRGVHRAYEDYFDLETQLAASGAVDALAHVDVVKKYGHRPETPPVDLYEKVVAAAAATGTAVEVSSAGLEAAAKEEYPAPEFLGMFHRAGVPITLASDAHAPAEAGSGHGQVVQAAKRAGYTERLEFDGRRRSLVPLA